MYGNQTIIQNNTIAEGVPALQIVMTECLRSSRVQSVYTDNIRHPGDTGYRAGLLNEDTGRGWM